MSRGDIAGRSEARVGQDQRCGLGRRNGTERFAEYAEWKEGVNDGHRLRRRLAKELDGHYRGRCSWHSLPAQLRRDREH